MASAKSSRSRASAPSGQVAAGVPHANGGGAGQEAGVLLADKLKIFKSDNFDPGAYVQSKCQSMNEKVRVLFCYNSRGISFKTGLIHGLAEGVNIDSLSAGSESIRENDISNVEDREPSDLEKWVEEFPDMLEVLLAERRVDEALDALDEAERVVTDAKQKQTVGTAELSSLQNAICEHRQKLVDQLAEAACQSSTHGVELRAAAAALKRLGDGPRAHSLLLSAHYQRLQYNMQVIHPTSTSYGGAYTAALSQQVFSAIGQALNDSQAVFGDEYASELVVWSTKQAEAFSHLVKRNALASSAAAGGLRAAAECVQIAIGHCSMLEARGRLSLSSVLLKLFRPSVEQALNANLKRIEESTAALAAADDWVLTYPPTEDGDNNLSAEMYISMDLNSDELEWAPSPIFQKTRASGRKLKREPDLWVPLAFSRSGRYWLRTTVLPIVLLFASGCVFYLLMATFCTRLDGIRFPSIYFEHIDRVEREREMGMLGAMVAHPEEVYPMMKLKLASDRIRRQFPAEPHWAFSYSMLQKVSRSFALVIQQLGPQLRDAVRTHLFFFSILPPAGPFLDPSPLAPSPVRCFVSCDDRIFLLHAFFGFTCSSHVSLTNTEVCVFYLVLRALDTVGLLSSSYNLYPNKIAEDDTSIPSDIKMPILQNFYLHIYDRKWHFSCKGIF
ncbi:hypothetical protein GW17_00028838 [Ensete ventricosum]|nr:hypothetical protein GW17_00028838 [Ensete ventricosum]